MIEYTLMHTYSNVVHPISKTLGANKIRERIIYSYIWREYIYIIFIEIMVTNQAAIYNIYIVMCDPRDCGKLIGFFLQSVLYA